jgi:XTP/dITP diphosphohydrolase
LAGSTRSLRTSRPPGRRPERERPPLHHSRGRPRPKLSSGAEELPDPKSVSHEPPAGSAAQAGSAFAELVAVMARLRAPGGCPWDAEQDHRSLAVHLIEEAHETLEAIDSGNMPELAEELGDLLLQVVFHSEIAAEGGHFDVTEVIRGLVAKLYQRHPHVFGDVTVKDAAEVVANWEVLKKQQKGRSDAGEGLPKGLPALVLAHKALRRLSGVGRDYGPSVARLTDLARAMGSEITEGAVGDLLLEAVGLAGVAGVDPEGALRRRSQALLEESGDSG